MAAIVDYDIPRGVAEDSYDILPALRNKFLAEPIREATVHHSARGNFAIRQGDWVFIDHESGADNREPKHVLDALGVTPDDESAELYNLAEDPNETRNVLRQYPEKASALKTLLDRYRAQLSSLP